MPDEEYPTCQHVGKEASTLSQRLLQSMSLPTRITVGFLFRNFCFLGGRQKKTPKTATTKASPKKRDVIDAVRSYASKFCEHACWNKHIS